MAFGSSGKKYLVGLSCGCQCTSNYQRKPRVGEEARCPDHEAPATITAATRLETPLRLRKTGDG